jgi:hypothetical protein
MIDLSSVPTEQLIAELRSRRAVLPVREMEHGRKGYERGCRCEACREARTQRSREARKLVSLGLREPSSHGRTGYDLGCRCEKCKMGKRAARLAGRA